MPLAPQPWSAAACAAMTVISPNGVEIARVPGWVHPVAFDHVNVLAARNDLGSGCSLNAGFTAHVAVGDAAPPADPSAWTDISFNPMIPADAAVTSLDEVSVPFPAQIVHPGENLYFAVEPQGDSGAFCYGSCDQQSGWIWAGADVASAQPADYQARLSGHGIVTVACPQSVLRNNVEDCPESDLTKIAAASSEDGDMAVERLIAPGAGASAREIVFEVPEQGSCTLPDELELVYWVEDAAAPTATTFTEVKVPKSAAYRITASRRLFAVTLDPPLDVAAGQALYAGIRLHPGSSGVCASSCGGDGAADGQAWWGHTHLVPGTVVWKSLASEGFLRSFRIAAIVDLK